MNTIRFPIQLNTFQIDDKDLTTNNTCEKRAQIFKMDESPVRHRPGKLLKPNALLLMYIFSIFFLA